MTSIIQQDLVCYRNVYATFITSNPMTKLQTLIETNQMNGRTVLVKPFSFAPTHNQNLRKRKRDPF